MKDFNLTRESVLVEAVENCYREMFAKAQPSADWDNIIKEYKDKKIDEEKDGPVYNRHYLSQAEYIYILNKYLEAYRINSEWESDIDVLKEYLTEGGSKDKYIEPHTDENGDYHPGYRGYEKVAPLKEQLMDKAYLYFDSEIEAECATNAFYDIVMGMIDNCQNFYRFNIDEQKFRNTLALGATPTSNKETVKKWWKEHYDVDVEIKERNPLLLWEYDNYGDEMDKIMTEEYGEDWEKYWWDKYEAEEAEKKAKLEAKLKELKNE